MEITLTLDEDAAALARRCTERRQMTLEALVADLLRREAERLAAIEEWKVYTREHAGHAGPGYRFRRSDCYEPDIYG